MKNDVKKLLSRDPRGPLYFLFIATLFAAKRSVIGAELSVQL